MNEYPDSALTVLKSIGQADLQTEEHHARYALLYSQDCYIPRWEIFIGIIMLCLNMNKQEEAVSFYNELIDHYSIERMTPSFYASLSLLMAREKNMEELRQEALTREQSLRSYTAELETKSSLSKQDIERLNQELEESKKHIEEARIFRDQINLEMESMRADTHDALMRINKMLKNHFKQIENTYQMLQLNYKTAENIFVGKGRNTTNVGIPLQEEDTSSIVLI